MKMVMMTMMLLMTVASFSGPVHTGDGLDLVELAVAIVKTKMSQLLVALIEGI